MLFQESMSFQSYSTDRDSSAEDVRPTTVTSVSMMGEMSVMTSSLCPRFTSMLT